MAVAEPTTSRRTGLAAWQAALACFVVAALAGALFRFALAYGWGPDRLAGLELGNIRHAHSHLMYFGWATPVLFLLIASALKSGGSGRVPRLGGILALVFVLAAIAYPPFLLWGYGLAPVGGRELPLAMIASGLNVIGWYAFAVAYLLTKNRPGGVVTHFFNAALFFMVLSTFGAWALAGIQPMGIDDPALSTMLVHVFLDTFSEGWFVLGVLGLAVAAAGESAPFPRWVLPVMVLGVPLAFPLAVPADYLSAGWQVAGSVGGLLIGAGSLGAVWWLWPRLRGVWRFALACLALKAMGQIVVSLTPGIDWATIHSLRILYLHLMLLGFVSVGLVAAAGFGRLENAFAGAAAILIASLLLFTPLLPTLLRGEWVYHAALWASIPVVIVAAWMMMRRRSVPSHHEPVIREDVEDHVLV